MANNTLPDNALESLKELTPSVVATVEGDKPYCTFISWLVAKDNKTLRMAVSTNARTTTNIRNNPNVSVEVFDKDLALSIQGTAKIIKEEIETITFPVAVIEINITEVNDNLFPGGTVKGKIPFAHIGDTEKAEELDKLVLEALLSD